MPQFFKTFALISSAFIFLSGILFALLIYSSHYIQKNYSQQFHQKITLQNPQITQSVQKISAIKKNIQTWEKKNYPKVKVDAFNSIANSSSHKPVPGDQIHFRLGSEPPILSNFLDNSYITSLINSYIFDSLLRKNPETLQYEPSLATQFSKQDVVWLKGKQQKHDPFKDQHNFVIGQIDQTQLPQNHSQIQKISIQLPNGQTQIIPSQQLRFKSNPDQTYIRPYDLGTVLTFQLNPNVQWHDGYPFSADDVIFTLKLIKNPFIPQMSHLRSYYQNLKSFQKINPFQVKIYFDTQYFMSLSMISSLPILPKHIFNPTKKTLPPKQSAEHFINHPYHLRPIGTGPFFLQKNSWKPKQSITLTRNDSYFNPSKRAYLKKIIFHFIPNQDSAFIAFKNGKIDFLSGLSSEQFFGLSNSSQQKWVKAFFYPGGFSYIGYNTRKPQLQNPKVRLAITLLLNRKYILDHLLFGFGHVVSGPQHFFGPAYDHSIKPHPYDPKQSIRLLNQAGWIDSNGDGIRDKNGVPFQLEMIYPQGSSASSSILPFLFEELNQLGISLKLIQLEWSVFLKNLSTRQFDLCILAWRTPIESDPYQIWHSSQWANQGSNHVGFQNQKADQIIETARRTLNPLKRHQLYFQLHQILHEQQPYLFLFTSPTKVIYHSRFRNVRFYHANQSFNLAEWFVPKHLQTSHILQ